MPDISSTRRPFNESSELSFHRLSTADVAPSRALDYYASAMQQALVPMDLQVRSPARFHAAVESSRLGQVELLRMIGSAHRVTRGQSELARSERRIYNLMVNRLAPWQLVQRGRWQLRAGDAVLVDSALPHELDVDTYELINIAMSAEFVERWLPDPSILAARPLARDGRWSSPLACFIAQLTPEYANGACPLPEDVMLQQVGALLMLAAAELDPSDRGPAPSLMSLHGQVMNQIRERLGDAALCPADIALALGIDGRSIHEILAAHGQTFAAVLLRLRLDEARRLAKSSEGTEIELDTIARKAGFGQRRRLMAAMRGQAGRN